MLQTEVPKRLHTVRQAHRLRYAFEAAFPHQPDQAFQRALAEIRALEGECRENAGQVRPEEDSTKKGAGVKNAAAADEDDVVLPALALQFAPKFG